MAALIASRPALAVTSRREITTDITPGRARGGRSNYTFDVAPDGRIIVTEDVQGSFDLILVRDGLTEIGHAPNK